MNAAICSASNCESERKAKGLCNMHYQRMKRGKPLSDPYRKRMPKFDVCQVDGCTREPKSKGLCNTHYARQLQGRPIDEPIKSPHFANSINDVLWQQKSNGYVYGQFEGRRLAQHRVIYSQYLKRALHPWENVHHKNGVRNDNRLENLELWITPQPNGQRITDLVEWCVTNYPDFVRSALEQHEQIK